MSKCVLSGLLSLLTVSLAADELDDRLKSFREAALPRIRELQAKNQAEAKTSGVDRKDRQTAVLAEIIARLGSEDLALSQRQRFRELEELRRYAELPPELNGLVADLVRDLPPLIESRKEKQLAELDRLVSESAAACLAAKTEAELDPILRELSRLAGSPRGDYGESERDQRALRRLQGAIRTVSTWQDYLAHQALENADGARAVMQRLMESTDYPIIARTEIEKRLGPGSSPPNFERQAIEAIRGVERIENLEATLKEFRDRPATDRRRPDANALAAFERLVAGYAALNAGFVADAFQTAMAATYGGVAPAPDWKAQLDRLRGLLLLKVLPPYLQVNNIPGPNEAESGADYLLRVAEELIKEARFGESIRVLETYRSVAFGMSAQPPSWIHADIEGLRAFAAAQRLAEAGSWIDAIRNFREAAQVAGRFTPTTESAKRLAALSEQHPEEAKAAAHLAEADAIYRRLNSEITNSAMRDFESRLPPEIRARMRPPSPLRQ